MSWAVWGGHVDKKRPRVRVRGCACPSHAPRTHLQLCLAYLPARHLQNKKHEIEFLQKEMSEWLNVIGQTVVLVKQHA